MDLDRRIREATETIPGIDVLVVFGSRAKGSARPDSDLDVAVLPAADFSGSLAQFLGGIAAQLAELAPDGRVDVVLLDHASDVLRQRIMEHGRVVLCRNEKAWKELRVRTMREYGDGEWFRRRVRAGLRRQLLGDEDVGRPRHSRKSPSGA